MAAELLSNLLDELNEQLLDPEQQAKAIIELEELTGESDYCGEIVKHGQLLRRVVEQVKSGYTKIKDHGVRCLANLASHEKLKEDIAKHEGVLDCLVALVKAEVLEVIVGDQTKTKRLACRTLANLAMNATTQPLMCVHKGMLACLFSTMRGQDAKCTEQCCRCLFNVALHRDNHADIAQHKDAVKTLLGTLCDSTAKAQDFVGRLLANLTTTAAVRKLFSEDPAALSALVQLLAADAAPPGPSEGVRALAAVTVWHLCDDNTIAGAFMAADVAVIAGRLLAEPARSVCARQMLMCLASLSKVPTTRDALLEAGVAATLEQLSSAGAMDGDAAFVCSDILVVLVGETGGYSAHSEHLNKCLLVDASNSLTGGKWILGDVVDAVHHACAVDTLLDDLCTQKPPLVPLLCNLVFPSSGSGDMAVRLAGLSSLLHLSFHATGMEDLRAVPSFAHNLDNVPQGSPLKGLALRLSWWSKQGQEVTVPTTPLHAKEGSGTKKLASAWEAKIVAENRVAVEPEVEEGANTEPSRVGSTAEDGEDDQFILIRCAAERHGHGAGLSKGLKAAGYQVVFEEEQGGGSWDEVCARLGECKAVVLDFPATDMSCHGRLEATMLAATSKQSAYVFAVTELPTSAWPAWLQSVLEGTQHKLVPVHSSWTSTDKVVAAMAEALETTCKDLSEERQKQKDVQLRAKVKEGIEQFNIKPSKGIAKMKEDGVFDDPASIAKFLYKTAGLQKKQIGEYLGRGDDENVAVLGAFTRLFDFTGLGIDDGMRVFLNAFTLPGEAQIIDRIMEAFATSWISVNKTESLDDPSTAYVLAFAIIMLNTDLHNPGVTKKMTKAQFVSNNRGINNGQDLPIDMLHHIYDRIRLNELRLTADGVGSTNAFVFPEHQGWLRKEGGKRKTVKRRWFILKANCLFYFKDPQEESPLGTVPLTEVCIKVKGKEGESTKHGYTLQLLSVHKGGKVKSNKMTEKGLVVGHHDSFVFYAETREERDRWMSVLKRSIVTNSTASAPASAISTTQVASGDVSSSDDEEDLGNIGKSHSLSSLVRKTRHTAGSVASISTIAPEGKAAYSDAAAIPTLKEGQGVQAVVGGQGAHMKWGVEDVCTWMVQAGFKEEQAAFREQQINGKALQWLGECAAGNNGLYVAIMEQRLRFATIGKVMSFATCLKDLIGATS